MSDLDLDAIRRRYEHSGEQAPDSTTWANRLFVSSADVPALLAEVARLKANQLPHGGKWTVAYGRPSRTKPVTIWHSGQRSGRDTVQRQVWRGPVEPIEAGGGE